MAERARDPAPASDLARPTAAHRLAAWRAQSPFTDPALLDRRLAGDGLDVPAFERLLASPPAAAEPPPAWVAEVVAAFTQPVPAGDRAALADLVADGAAGGLFHWAIPLAARARGRLRAQAEELLAGREAEWLTADRAVESWSAALPDLLFPLLARALVVELHAARLAGRLTGASPEERFADFVRGLAEPEGALAVAAEFPVLARAVVERLAAWVEVAAEFLRHLAADRAALAEWGVAPGAVTGLAGSGGDPHRGGRAVLFVTFEGGGRVVYKPRSLAPERLHGELLAWLDGPDEAFGFRTAAVLDRGDHGWMEQVAPAPVTEAAGLERFYRRLGAQLALLTVLEATDLHFENMIAAGDQPVLVDLESLCHPRVPLPPARDPGEGLVAGVLTRSVLRTGLLPFRVGLTDDGSEGVDLSGLGAGDEATSPDPVLVWERAGTDEMHAVLKRLPLPAAANRPRLGDPRGDRIADPLAHRGAFEAGFTVAYRRLAARRDELAGRLAALVELPVRAILRATRGYHRLLGLAYHPQLLGDALDRDRHLDRLWHGVSERPHLERTVRAERAQLERGDIPYFTARAGGRELHGPSGEVWPEFFARSPLDEVRGRLAALGDADLERQLWLLRAAVSTLELTRPELAWPSYEPRRGVVAEPDPAPRLVARAVGLGEELLASACTDPDQGRVWVGLEWSGRRWSLAALGEDLYAGSLGIALFLGELGRATGEPRFARAAREALATQAERLRLRGGEITTVGAFQGWGSVFYGYRRAAALGLGDALAPAVAVGLGRVRELLADERDLDVVGGSAGLLVTLLGLAGTPFEGAARELAEAAGGQLVALAEPHGDGLAWRTRIAARAPQSGFAHGTAGMAWALARLARATGEASFVTVARSAFRYEHGCYRPGADNWLDLDDSDEPALGRARRGGERATAMAWCYGAPGIALALLDSRDLAGAEEFAGDLERALRATAERGFGHNHCLCHGDLGNLLILDRAARALAREDLAARVRAATASLLASLEDHGPLWGTPLAVSTPGLLTGLAGIGLGLLELAFPGRVPSLLALDPPG